MQRNFTRAALAAALISLVLIQTTAVQAQSASISVPLPTPSPTPQLQGPAISNPEISQGKPAETPAADGVEAFIAKAKKPVDWASWGADFRARDEYYDNIVSLSDDDPLHEQNVIRLRPRLWAAVTPLPDVSLNTRLTGEARNWTRDSFVGAYHGKEGMEWRYGIFDNMNAKFTNVLAQPLTITAGRQDIFLGDFYNYWLTGDGTPDDGSFTYFLDAVRSSLELKEIKTKVELIGIRQRAQVDDSWLPTIPAEQTDYSLTEQDETGAIFYLSNQSLAGTRIDGYFIYKGDDKQLANGDDADIYTFGSRVSGRPEEHFFYALEGAYQFGWKNDATVTVPADLGASSRELSAYGANGQLSYLVKDRLNNQLHLVFEYLSGDDPKSQGTDEMFDVLWGRWPRWSELYIYSYIVETGRRVAQWNNLGRIGGGWTMEPIKDTGLGFYYNALFAPEEVPTRAVNAALFSSDGSFRGHFLQTVLTHSFSKHMKGHIWLEFLFEGDYYSHRQTMAFIRPEIYFTF